MSTMKLVRNCLLAILFLGALGKPLIASETITTGTYTNLRMSAQTGDLNGYEIRLLLSSDGYVSVVQMSEGGPGIVTLQPVRIQGKQIVIDFSNHRYGLIKFEGSVNRDQINGVFTFDRGGADSVVLRRGKSYWER